MFDTTGFTDRASNTFDKLHNDLIQVCAKFENIICAYMHIHELLHAYSVWQNMRCLTFEGSVVLCHIVDTNAGSQIWKYV